MSTAFRAMWGRASRLQLTAQSWNLSKETEIQYAEFPLEAGAVYCTERERIDACRGDLVSTSLLLFSITVYYSATKMCHFPLHPIWVLASRKRPLYICFFSELCQLQRMVLWSILVVARVDHRRRSGFALEIIGA